MWDRSFYLGEKGFSIIGIIVLAGMASGLAMALTGIFKKQQISQRKTEAYLEVNKLSYAILRTLENGDACIRTLGVGTRMINSARWTAVKNQDGEVVFDKSDKYGDGLVKIQSMAPKNIQIQGTKGDMSLKIEFKKLGTGEEGDGEIVKTFPVSIEVDDSLRLIKCRANSRNIVTTAKERMCRIMDGVFDPSSEECNLDHLSMEGQKQICNSMGGVFESTNSRCDMNPFVMETVKEMCKSVQGTYSEFTKKCRLLSSSSSSSGNEELLQFNAPYPVCRIGFGVGISPGSIQQYGLSTFATCFGPEVAKLFRSIRNEENIKVRTAPWKSHWTQYDGNGALEQINFYRRPRIPYEDYRNKIYFVDNDPKKGLREMYRLVNVQIRLKYARTGVWYTFAFAVGINYLGGTADDPDSWMQAEQDLKKQGKRLFFDEQWLEPWAD